MKTGFKKLFKKKQQNVEEADPGPKDNYTSMSSNSLFSMPVPELVSIIFKYDSELKTLNQELGTLKDQHQLLKQNSLKLQDESSLYKETKDNAQFECHRLATELNEALTSLDSCQSQLELVKTQLASRDSILVTLNSRISELEKQNCELQLSGINFNQTDEIENLRKKLAEFNKQEQIIRELKVKNEILEKEVKKISASAAENKEQARMWREKTNIFEKALNETQAEMAKKKSEHEELMSGSAKLAFSKESTETENKSLKESILHKEATIKKKNEKIEELQNIKTQLEQSITLMRIENDSKNLKIEEDFKERLRQENERKEKEWQTTQENLKAELNSLQEVLKNFEDISKKLEQNETEKDKAQQDLASKAMELKELGEKVENLAAEKSKLEETLKISNNKRELARNEIMKLTQKLESAQKAGINMNENKRSIKPSSPEEIKMLSILKPELDSLYKALMTLITDAKGDFYSVKIGDFTSFEKKMNNLVVMLHEHIEEFSSSTNSNATVPPIPAKGRTPIKLFSCIADQDETQPRTIPKVKRPINMNENPLILRRSSAK